MENVPNHYKIEKLENDLTDVVVRMIQFFLVMETRALVETEQKMFNALKKEYDDKTTELNELNPGELNFTPTECAEISKRTGKLIPEITSQLKAIRISQRILDESMRQGNKSKIDVILDLLKITN